MEVLLSHRLDYLVQVKCCRVRYYRPEDLITLIGDMPVLSMETKMHKCEDCERRDNMTVRLFYPTAVERQRMTVRRLVEVRTIRRPVWRDE